MPDATPDQRFRQIRKFAGELGRAAWFTACGEPLTPAEQADAEKYLTGLGLPVRPITGIATWAEAAATAQRPDWQPAWWRADEASARALHQAAAALLSETELLMALSAVTLAAANLHGPAALAAARAGVADPALSRVAAGAAALACHQMGLVHAANAGEDHPLAIKYRLFAGGRWLLGVIGDRCYLF